MKFNVLSAFSVALLMFIILLQSSRAYPAPDEFDEQEFAEYEPLENVHSRIRRATCDLLSFQSKWVTPNHAACAAHCIVLGKKGGRCKDAVCHCRN
ncbi:defensin-like [Lycorma delicatula]|uniref:defensin-like n=1 Tax=Lycorma delicatula TaxID=130591 RepID=UPI003F50DC39